MRCYTETVEDRLLTVKQVAAMLSIGKPAVYRWINEGIVPSFTDPKGRILIRLQDVLKPRIGKCESAAKRGKLGYRATFGSPDQPTQ